MGMSRRRANITVANGRVFVVTCRHCGRHWAPHMRRPMGRRWWVCPGTCNADAYERTPNEVARHEAAHRRSIPAALVFQKDLHPSAAVATRT